MYQKSPFILGLPSSTLTKEVIAHLKFCRPYGIILFQRNLESIEQTRSLCEEIESLIGETIFCIDYEGGKVNRFPLGSINPPSSQALANFTNPLKAVQTAAKLQAKTLREWGIHWSFSPNLDLAYYPYNTAIANRSFGIQPQTTALLGEAIVKEYEKYNIASCLKHFPGHGSVAQDTHLSFATITKQEANLNTQDWYPFKELIYKKAPSVMLAHVCLPQDTLPASLSAKTVSILREQWQYEGLIITDCIEMQALQKKYSPKEIIQYGMQANIDLWISSFSLLSDLDLQKQLVTNYRELEPTLINKKQKEQRMENFFHRYHTPPLPIGTEEKKELEQECLSLHEKSFITYQANYSQLKPPFTILYAPSPTQNTITATSIVATFIDELCQKTSLFQAKKAIPLENIAELKSFLSNHTGSILWISENAIQSTFFEQWIALLTKKAKVAHLAAIQPFDLQGVFPCEFASFGLSAYWSATSFSTIIQTAYIIL